MYILHSILIAVFIVAALLVLSARLTHFCTMHCNGSNVSSCPWAETQFGEKALFSTGGNSAVHRTSRSRQKVKTFSLKVNLGGCCHNSSLTFLTLTLSSEKEQPRQRVYRFSWTPFVLVLPFMVLRKLLVALSIIPATSSRPSPLAWSGNGIKEKIDWRIKDC